MARAMAVVVTAGAAARAATVTRAAEVAGLAKEVGARAEAEHSIRCSPHNLQTWSICAPSSSCSLHTSSCMVPAATVTRGSIGKRVPWPRPEQFGSRRGNSPPSQSTRSARRRSTSQSQRRRWQQTRSAHQGAAAVSLAAPRRLHTTGREIARRFRHRRSSRSPRVRLCRRACGTDLLRSR